MPCPVSTKVLVSHGGGIWQDVYRHCKPVGDSSLIQPVDARHLEQGFAAGRSRRTDGFSSGKVPVQSSIPLVRMFI